LQVNYRIDEAQSSSPACLNLVMGSSITVTGSSITVTGSSITVTFRGVATNIPGLTHFAEWYGNPEGPCKPTASAVFAPPPDPWANVGLSLIRTRPSLQNLSRVARSVNRTRTGKRPQQQAVGSTRVKRKADLEVKTLRRTSSHPTSHKRRLYLAAWKDGGGILEDGHSPLTSGKGCLSHGRRLSVKGKLSGQLADVPFPLNDYPVGESNMGRTGPGLETRHRGRVGGGRAGGATKKAPWLDSRMILQPLPPHRAEGKLWGNSLPTLVADLNTPTHLTVPRHGGSGNPEGRTDPPFQEGWRH